MQGSRTARVEHRPCGTVRIGSSRSTAALVQSFGSPTCVTCSQKSVRTERALCPAWRGAERVGSIGSRRQRSSRLASLLAALMLALFASAASSCPVPSRRTLHGCSICPCHSKSRCCVFSYPLVFHPHVLTIHLRPDALFPEGHTVHSRAP